MMTSSPAFNFAADTYGSSRNKKSNRQPATDLPDSSLQGFAFGLLKFIDTSTHDRFQTRLSLRQRREAVERPCFHKFLRVRHIAGQDLDHTAVFRNTPAKKR